MRGASALDEVLREFPDAPLRVLVIWEPVIATDVAPPFSSVLGLIGDGRVAQFWDPERTLSDDIVRAVNQDPTRHGFDEALPEGFVVWDAVAVFGTGAHWADDLPVPVFQDAPVYAVIDGLREALSRELERPPTR